MDDVSDMQKDRAIAERIGHVWQNFNSPSWCTVTWYTEDEGVEEVERVEWPAYEEPEAFIRLLGYLADQPHDELGYSLGECDCRDDCTDHVAQVFYEHPSGWTSSPAISACPMTAIRDAVYRWIEVTND
jgi:hypothetical protein